MTVGSHLSARLQRLISDAEELRLSSSKVEELDVDYYNFPRRVRAGTNEDQPATLPEGISFANAISRYSKMLSDRNHLVAAVNSAERAIITYDSFEEFGDNRTRISLCSALFHASKLVVQTGDGGVAVEYASRSIAILEGLEPETEVQHMLAMGYENLANHLANAKREEEAKTTLVKAITAYESLAKRVSPRFLKDAAHAMTSLSCYESDAQKSKEYSEKATQLMNDFDNAARESSSINVEERLPPQAEVTRIVVLGESGLLSLAVSPPSDLAELGDNLAKELLIDKLDHLLYFSREQSNNSMESSLYEAASRLHDLISQADSSPEFSILPGWLAFERLQTIYESQRRNGDYDLLPPLDNAQIVALETVVNIGASFFLAFSTIRSFLDLREDIDETGDAFRISKEIIHNARECEILDDRLLSFSLLATESSKEPSVSQSDMKSTVLLAKAILQRVGYTLLSGRAASNFNTVSSVITFIRLAKLDALDLVAKDRTGLKLLVERVVSKFG